MSIATKPDERLPSPPSLVAWANLGDPVLVAEGTLLVGAALGGLGLIFHLPFLLSFATGLCTPTAVRFFVAGCRKRAALYHKLKELGHRP